MTDSWLTAIISILVTILFAFIPLLIQRKKKRIVIEVLSDLNVLNVNENRLSKVKVMFGTRQIDNAHLVTFRIINLGKVPILSTEYFAPLKFEFGPEAEIIEATIVNKSSKVMEAHIISEENKVELVPTLLNSNDWISIQVLLTNYDEDEFTVTGHIVNIKNIEIIYSRILKNDTNSAIYPVISIFLADLFVNLFICFSFKINDQPPSILNILTNNPEEVIIRVVDQYKWVSYTASMHTDLEQLFFINMLFVLLIMFFLLYNLFLKRYLKSTSTFLLRRVQR